MSIYYKSKGEDTATSWWYETKRFEQEEKSSVSAAYNSLSLYRIPKAIVLRTYANNLKFLIFAYAQSRGCVIFYMYLKLQTDHFKW
jgi:hypothetical protein